MTLVQGELKLVTDRPVDSISEVWVRARETRGQGDGLTVGVNDRVPVSDGALSFTALPGAAVLVLVQNGIPVETLPMLIADEAEQSLRVAVQAAQVAGAADQRVIEQLSIEVAAHAARAEQYRNEAAASASAAKASESAAATSESNAKQSETNSKQSEDNAGDYAAVATTAATEAVDAMEAAATSESEAKAATSRIDAIEAMAGLAPESPVDGQTANLIEQPDTLTRRAFKTAFTESVPLYLQEESPGGLRDTYVSVSEAPLNVQRYGGDLQAALDAASTAVANLGGEVYAPAGTYTGSFNVPDNVKLSGAGQRATRIRGVGADAVLTVGNKNHVSDLYVLGDRTAGGVGVAFRPAETHVTLRNLAVNGHDTGILLNRSWICQIEQSTIQACGTGIRMRGTNNAVQVNGGEIQNCGDGVLQESNSSGWGVSFRTNIEGNSGQGVKFLGSSYGFSFTDCYFESNTEGHIGIHFLAEMLKITGCQFLNRAAFGLRFDGSVAHGVVVSDNLFNLTGEGDPRAIYVSSSGRDFYIARNYYLGLSKGKFDPAIDYEGIRLSWHQGNKMVMAPSARTQSAGGASLNIPHGESPTNPNDGDVWTTSEGMFVRINGVTKKITQDPISEEGA